MYSEDPIPQGGAIPHDVTPVSSGVRVTLVPVLICAGACVVLMRTGFFSLFFLVPLGFCAVACGSPAAWFCLVISALGNAILSAGFSLRYGGGLAGAGPEVLYFTVLALGFTWIMAGNPREDAGIPRIRTVFRLAAAAVAGALMFLGIAYAGSGDGSLSAFARSQAETLSSAYIASSGADAAQQAFLERLLSPDRIMELLWAVSLRGGVLISAFFLFFFSRQAAFVLNRLFRRRGNSGRDLINFYVPRGTIWVFSLCLPVILICRMIPLEIIEIAVWNLLVVCAMMFLAQGGGIVLFTFTRRSMPVIVRLFCGLLLVLAVFSPVINLLAAGALVLTGIAENWLPLRVIKVNSD